MHKHRLTGLDIGARHEHVPGSYSDERQSRRLFPTQLRRLRNDVHTRNGDELSITTIAPITNDVVLAAEIVLAAKTRLAMSARNTGLDHHLIARFHPRNELANLSDNP